MTIDEAIKIFESWAQVNYAPTREAAELALLSLRTQQEREKGCQWCNAGIFGEVGVGEFLGQKKVTIRGGNSQIPKEKQFKLCPMCGRTLKGGADNG